MYEKDALRKVMKERALCYDDGYFASEDLLSCTLIKDMEWYQGCGTLFGYYPIRGEVDIRPLLADALATRLLALPKTQGDGSLRFHLVGDLSALKRGRFGIPEPAEGPVVTPGADDLIILPALAYDRAHRRLGRGAGYYDRYLASYATVPTVGISRSYQLVETIPTQKWDRSVDYLVCANTLY